MKEMNTENRYCPLTSKATAELIPGQPAAELIEKSFAENTTAESQIGFETF